MAVVMEVADDRNVDLFDDARYGRRRGFVVHRHPHELAAGLVQGTDLGHRGGHVGGVGIGHRLDDDRVSTAHLHATHVHDHATSAAVCGHASIYGGCGTGDERTGARPPSLR